MRVAVIILILLQGTSSFSQVYYPTGRLPLYNITPGDYGLPQPQNFDIIQDEKGLIYIGNNGGVIVFDGVNWIGVQGNDKKALCFGISDEGEVFVGGENNLGKITHDTLGQIIFESFVENIPDSLQKFGRLDFMEVLNEELVFRSADHVFRFDHEGNYLGILSRSYNSFFQFNGNVYLNNGKTGLGQYQSGEIKGLINGSSLIEYRVFHADVNYVTGINELGLIQFRIENDEVVILKEVKEYKGVDFVINEIRGLLSHKNYFFVSTRNYGLLVFDNDWNLRKVINSKNSELQDDFIRGMAFDSDNNLWLALDKGVSVIDIESPITYYGPLENINGNINDMNVLNSQTLAGGQEGLLILDELQMESFQKAEGITGECWATEIVNLDNSIKLLLALDASVALSTSSGFEKVISAYPYDIQQSLFDSNRVWVGDDRGYITLYWNGQKFEEEYRNNKLSVEIRKIQTDTKGNVWLGSRNGGVFRIDEKELDSISFSKPYFYDTTSGLPDEISLVTPYNVYERTYFATSKGIFEFDSTENRFEPANSFEHKDNISERNIFRMLELSDSLVWLVTYNEDIREFENGIFDIKERSWSRNQFDDLNEGVQFANAFDGHNNQLWVGGSEGIFRIKDINSRELQKYSAYVREVRYDPDSVLFGGVAFDDFKNNTYKYSKKPLRFTFGANSYKRKDDLKFKYFLEGFDESWTDWNEEAEAVYTNLPGGSYTMRVKAIDFSRNVSQEATFAFIVLPPWYLTPWAYSLYLFGFIGFVFGAIRVSTISLQRIIKENTKEIVAQKEEIEAKNSTLENQKGRIEKQNLNILDSIRYAKRIQVATLPTDDKIHNLVQDSWVMYRPKDIVSGDFYWLEKYQDDEKERIMFAAVDCTGHGVPGAFMSIIGFNGLNRVVREYRLSKPADVLDRLNEIITNSLNQQGTEREEIKDGMDMSLCALDREGLSLEYSGAHNALYIIRKEGAKLIVNDEERDPVLKDKGFSLFEIKADKQPIGAFENRKNFTHHQIQLMKDDMIILFTDGYADQFGGPKGKKFFYKPFKRLLLSVAGEEISKQHEIIEQTFNEWISYPDKNGEAHEQVDDICVIGVKV